MGVPGPRSGLRILQSLELLSGARCPGPGEMDHAPAFLLIWKASDQVFDPRYSHCLKSDDRPSIEIHSSEYGISRITKLAFFEQIQRWPYTVIFMFCPRTRTVLFSSVRYLFLGSMPFLDVIRRFPVSGSSKMLLIRRSKFWSL